MRTWRLVETRHNRLFGVRDDLKTFWVQAPFGRKELDTFLRDDCTCAVGQPRCDYHEQLFAGTIKVEEVVAA